jgi:hypothetical protein
MVEAAASGCIDYKNADSTDYKFLLKEIWMCEYLQSKRVQALTDEHLAIKRHLATVNTESLEAYFKFVNGPYRKALLPWEDVSVTTDAERYNEIFGDLDQKDIQKLEDHLEKKVQLVQQQELSRQHLQKEADRMVEDRFKHRIK